MLEHFGQIDFSLASRQFQEHVRDVYYVRGAALASHHFLLQCYVRMDIPKVARQRAARLDVAALSRGPPASAFQRAFVDHMGNRGPLEGAIDQLNTTMVDAFADAARK
eukprot:7905928-Pyramimonas_sp.AAC.1